MVTTCFANFFNCSCAVKVLTIDLTMFLMLTIFLGTGSIVNKCFPMTTIVHMYTTNSCFNTIKCSDSATVCETLSYMLAIEENISSMQLDSLFINAIFELQLLGIGSH